MGRWLTACLVLVAANLASAEFTPPPKHTAEYTIAMGPLTAARVTTRFYPAGESAYLYRLHARATGIVSLFAGEHLRERSRGRITDNGYQPQQYVSRRSGDDDKRAELEFDWQERRVRSNSGEPSWDLAMPEGTLDRLVSPLQLMHDLSVGGESERRMTYHIADDDEIKSYEVEIGQRDDVATPAGRFEAVQVVRRSDDGDTETRLWCAPALDYLPVKISQREDGEDKVTLRLESIDGLSPDESVLSAR